MKLLKDDLKLCKFCTAINVTNSHQSVLIYKFEYLKLHFQKFEKFKIQKNLVTMEPKI